MELYISSNDGAVYCGNLETYNPLVVLMLKDNHIQTVLIDGIFSYYRIFKIVKSLNTTNADDPIGVKVLITMEANRTDRKRSRNLGWSCDNQ